MKAALLISNFLKLNKYVFLLFYDSMNVFFLSALYIFELYKKKKIHALKYHDELSSNTFVSHKSIDKKNLLLEYVEHVIKSKTLGVVST